MLSLLFNGNYNTPQAPPQKYALTSTHALAKCRLCTFSAFFIVGQSHPCCEVEQSPRTLAGTFNSRWLPRQGWLVSKHCWICTEPFWSVGSIIFRIWWPCYQTWHKIIRYQRARQSVWWSYISCQYLPWLEMLDIASYSLVLFQVCVNYYWSILGHLVRPWSSWRYVLILCVPHCCYLRACVNTYLSFWLSVHEKL